jgi:hypothetical protein
MGWEDRDWAKLNDEELRDLYGMSPGQARSPTRGRFSGRTTTSARQRFWIGVGLGVLTLGLFLWSHRQTAAPLVPGAAPALPTVLFGIRGTDASVPSQTPEGTDAVCTEEAFGASTQQWYCLTWALNVRHLPVVQPAQYQGPCTHLVAATDQARWNCVGNEPFSPGQLPPSPGIAS